MQVINAATIHAAALAAAAIAPEYDQAAELAARFYATSYLAGYHLDTFELHPDNLHAATGRQVVEVTAVREWARDAAIAAAHSEYLHAAGEIAPAFVTIKTSERGRHKVRNLRARLEAFAALVKANRKAFGGGIAAAPRAAKPAQSWSAPALKVIREAMQERAYADALRLAEEKAGALFYTYSTSKGAQLFAAPVDVAELPGIVTALRVSDGKWVAMGRASGCSIGTACGSRAEAQRRAVAVVEVDGLAKLAAAIERAGLVDQAAARAAWIEAHGIEADRVAPVDQEAHQEAAQHAPADQVAAEAQAEAPEGMAADPVAWLQQLEAGASATLAAVLATGQALADAAQAPAPAIAAGQQLATVCAGADAAQEGATPGQGHAAGLAANDGAGGPDAGPSGPTRPAPAAARPGVQDLDDAPAARPGVQDLDQVAAAIDAAAFIGDISVGLARGAYQGTSMSPERRGDNARAEFAQTLAEDYAHFHAHAVKGGTLADLAEQFSRYRAGMASRYRAYLASSSRCVSSFIAGPSNFPARRMNKRADIAHKRLGEYLDGRELARRAVVRNLRPDLRPIMAGDADAAERLAVEIAKAERLQSSMKAANAAIRKHAKAGQAAQVAALVDLGFTEDQGAELLRPDSCRRIGFPDYALTNNGANIRRMVARLEVIERNQAQPVREIEGAEGVRLEDDAPANRVRLFFPGKPAAEIRDQLKAAGFRWAPSVGAWQAYRNWRAMEAAQRLAGVSLADAAPARQDAPKEAAEPAGVQDLDQAAPAPAGVQDLAQAASKGPAAGSWDAWEGEIVDQVAELLQIPRSDAAGMVEAQAFSGALAQAWGKGQDAAPTAAAILAAEAVPAAGEVVQDLDQAPAARQGVQDLAATAPRNSAAPKIIRKFVPELGQRVASKIAGAWEAWLYTRNGVPLLVFYSGKARKPSAHNRFNATPAGLHGRMVYLQQLAATADRIAQRALDEAAERAKPHALTVGAILVHSWGYEQTNVDYFQVTSLRGRSMVEVRPIGRDVNPTGDMTGKCVPCPGQFTGDAWKAKVATGGAVRVPGHSRGYAAPVEIVGALPNGAPVYRAHSFSSYA